MHCQSCGAEISEQLKFCRSCGASLSPAADKPRSVPFRLMFLFLLIAIVGVVGFVGTFVTAFEMANSGLPRNIIMPILMLGATMIFTIIGLLSWLLSRLINLSQQTERPAPGKKVAHPPAPQLAAQPEAIPSVVEHTTRSFEPAPYKDPGVAKPPA